MAGYDIITRTVKTAVTALCKRRCSKDGFYDDTYVRERCFVSTCEGLECIILPCIEFERINLPGLLKTFPKLLECLQSDIDYLIQRSKKINNEYKFVFPGDPYLGIGRSITAENQLPNLDSAAFAISTMLHLKFIIENEKFLEEKFPISEMNELIRDGLTQIKNKHIQYKGWPWGGTSKKTNIYFSWSVLETLFDLFEYEPKGDLIEFQDDLRAEINDAKNWIEKHVIDDMAEGKDLGKDIDKTYNYIESLISLTLTETDKYTEIADFLKHLLPFCDKIANKTLSAQYEIDGHDTRLTDYSIIPLLLRGLSAALLEFGANETFKKELGIMDHNKVIRQRFDHLEQRKTKEGLWAYDAKKFELYYTERTIEALVTYYNYRRQRKKQKLPTRSFKKMKEELRKTIDKK